MRRFPLQVLAVAALPIGLGAHVPLVWAQSSTTIYGILDANVRHDQGSNSSANSVSSGLSRGSRLGFKVIEDLGSGLSAMSFLEMGFNVNSGEILSSGSVAPGFGRQSWLALGSRDLGYWALGRQYTPIFALSAGALDPFGANYLGTITTTQAIQGGLTSRVSGALTYSYGYQFAMESPTPRKGASFSALYAPGAVANSNAGTQAGLAFGYGQGNWFLGYGYHRTQGSATATPASSSPVQWAQVVGGTYDLGPLMLFTALHQTRNDASGGSGGSGGSAIQRRNLSFGTRIPVGVGQFIGQFQRSSDKTVANKNTSNFSVAYEHFLSKRTVAYVNYGRNSNNANAAVGLYQANSGVTVAPGSSPSAWAIGMRHSF